MPTHVRFFRDDVERLVTHILRVGRHEANAHIRKGAGHAAEQAGEVYGFRVLICLPTIAVDVLPKQGYFLKMFVVQVGHFAQDALHVSTTFSSARIRHDAIVAEIVATAHDAYEARELASADPFGHDVAISFARREFDVHRLVSGFRLRDQVRQTQISVGTGHEVGVVIVEEAFFYAFGHTAQDADNQSAPVLAQRVERVQAVNDALLCIVAHTASIEKYGVSFIEVLRRLVARHFHDARHDFTIGHVHLATICFYQKMLHCLFIWGCKVNEND